jgi:hypothetical protein
MTRRFREQARSHLMVLTPAGLFCRLFFACRMAGNQEKKDGFEY